MEAGRTSHVIERLRGPLAAAGFNILLPLSPAAFDAACAATPPPRSPPGSIVSPAATSARLGQLLPGASGAVIVGSGGRELFARFQAAPEARDGRPDPLDRYTRRAVISALRQALGADAATQQAFFPFTDSLPALPFQRLGRAAGIGAPGPLGLQIHPTFGPWWAYRALVALTGEWPGAVDTDADAAGALDGPVGCEGCDAPCVAACPGGAVRAIGFSVADCHAHRRVAPECRLSCVARIRCVRGPEQRYSDAQLAFHMTASLPRLG